ncbi:hypothetical protein [Prauserella flavalba]
MWRFRGLAGEWTKDTRLACEEQPRVAGKLDGVVVTDDPVTCRRCLRLT